MNTDRWYYRVFQSAAANALGLDPGAPSDSGFHHRLAAQTYRFLQQQPQVEHWAVLVS